MTPQAQAQVQMFFALLRARSVEMFFSMELMFLVIAIVLAVFVYQKYSRQGLHGVLSPLRFLMLVGVMLGTTGFLALYWGVNHLVFALAFGIGVTISIVDPVAAVGFFLANLLARPWEMSAMDEMGFIPKTLGVLSLVSWIFHRGRAKSLSMLFNGPCRIYFMLAGWFLISSLTGGDLVGGLTDFMGGMLIVLIIFVLITSVPETELDLGILERVVLLSITGSIIHAILVTVAQDGFEISTHRLEDNGMTGNSNDLGAIIVQALAFAVIPAIRAGKKFFSRRLIAFATLPILLTGLWLTQSRGAMIGVVVSAVTYFTIKAKDKRRAGIIIACCVPLLFAFYSALSLARHSDDLQESSESRRAFVIAGINMGFHNPAMGVGIGNFPKMWQTYAIGNVVETGTRTAHNTWVLAFAETGFPGLILLISLYVASFKKGLLVRDVHPEMLSALTGYGVAMTFLSHTYTFFPYVLFALVIVAAKIYKANPDFTEARIST